MGSSYLVVLFDLLARYAWLADNEGVQRLLFGGGLLLALGGGGMAVTERHLGRLWAYAVLMDLGYILLGLSFQSEEGQNAVLFALASRLVSLLLAGSALATIRHRATALNFQDLLGIGVRLPLSMMAFAIGGTAMLGIPMTAGFPSHWAVLRLVADSGSNWGWALILASFLGMIGFLRAFAVMLSPTSEAALAQVEGEPRVATGFLLALGALSILIGLAPQLLTPLFAFMLGSNRF